MILFEKKYQTFDTVFHQQMKHLEVRQKYSAARRIFNSLLGVSSGDETLLLMLDRYCIKIRYPIYREGSDFHCFYFSQTTTSTFPSLCFSWLLFNLFLTTKLNSKFTLRLFSNLEMMRSKGSSCSLKSANVKLDERISSLIIKMISWIIMNQFSTSNFFSGWLSSTCMSYNSGTRLCSFCNVENIKRDCVVVFEL